MSAVTEPITTLSRSDGTLTDSNNEGKTETLISSNTNVSESTTNTSNLVTETTSEVATKQEDSTVASSAIPSRGPSGSGGAGESPSLTAHRSGGGGGRGDSTGTSPSIVPNLQPHQIPCVLADPEAEGGDIHLTSYEAINDPMRNMTYELSRWNAFKLRVLGVATIPLRSLAILGVLSFGGFLSYVSHIGLKNVHKKAKKKGGSRSAAVSSPTSAGEEEGLPAKQLPLKGLRRFIASGIFYAARVILLPFGFYRIKVSGKLDPRATIIVSNHCGPFETAALLYLGKATVVSRVENASIPFIGTILRALQCIFVNRNSVDSRDDTLAQICERAKAPPGVWPPLLIFPEGTTGNGRSILRFRTGAFQPGEPVQPVVCKFHWRHLDPTWGDERIGMGSLVLRVMSQFYNSLEVQFLPLYCPSEAERADPTLYAENVRQYMCAHSGVPPSNYSLDDFFVAQEASKYNIPHSEALLGMEMLRRESNITARDVKKIMQAFAELDTKKRGCIGYAAFLQYLGMPDTVMTRTVFAEVLASETAGAPSSSAPAGGSNSSNDAAAKAVELLNETDFTASVSDAASHIKKPLKANDSANASLAASASSAASTSGGKNARAITFRQFLRAIIKINKSISTEDKVSQAFDIVNFTGTGKITKEELCAVADFAIEHEMSAHQIKDLYNKMDTRRVGFIDKIEFGAFLRSNPIYLAMFEATRRYRRGLDPHNPVFQANEAKAKGHPITVEMFKDLVEEYRQKKKELGEDTLGHF